MIIKASQRGHASELARHLLNEKDNEFVKVHAIDGFMAENLKDALHESYTFSQGTKCEQHLFSVSFNPPKDEQASTKDFEQAIERCAQKMGLENQPRAIVFHEKNGRRHAHAVFCRIDTDTMTAVPMSYYKNKMAELSKELYLEHDWKLPHGHIDRAKRNPLNFSLNEWQQAKRMNEDPRLMKQALRECWAISDNKKSFETALEQHGYYLARGRRGYVAVDWCGEVISLKRWLGASSKELQSKLGEKENLQKVEDVSEKMDKTLINKVQSFQSQTKQFYQRRFEPLNAAKNNMVSRHKKARQQLSEKLQKRWDYEVSQRAARHSQGLRGLWHRVTGKYAEIERENEIETYDANRRDQIERDNLVFSQLSERQNLQIRFDSLNNAMQKDLSNVKTAVFSKLPEKQLKILENNAKIQKIQPKQGFDLEM